MGFLDAFSSNDPQSEAMRQGLLRMGLALMQAKGNPGQILGQAGTEGVNGMQSFQDRQFKQKLQQDALAEIARKKVIQGREDTAFTDAQRLAALPSKFYTQAQPGGFDATGGIETDTNAPNNMIPGKMDIQKLITGLYSSGIPGSVKEAIALEAQQRRDAPTIHSIGVGGGAYWDQPTGQMKMIPGSGPADSSDLQAIGARYPKGSLEYNKAVELLIAHKTNPAPPGFMRDEKGNLKGDPVYDAAQMRWRGANATAAQNSAVVLTEEGQKAYADLALQGKLPSGWGGKGLSDRNTFLNKEGAKRYGAGGTGASLAGDQAAASANKTALAAIQKDLTAIRPYKEMLDKNADIAITLAGKVLKSNAALVNKPITWIAQNLTNSPDVAELMAQNHFVTTEAARVLSNPRLVGQMTDTAVRDMQSVINGNAPLGSYVRVLERIKMDGNNRVDAMQKERDKLAGSFTTTPERPVGLPSLSDIEAELAKRK